MPEGKFSQYCKGVSAGSFAVGVNMLSGFLSLLLLNRMLGKEVYGALAFAMALIFMIQLVSTAGLDRTLLFRVSEIKKENGSLVGGGQAAAILITVIFLGIFVSGIILIFCIFIEKYFNKDPYWICVASLTIPFSGINAVMCAWYQANEKSHIAQIMAILPNLFKIIILFFILIFFPTQNAVALTLVTAMFFSSISWLFVIPRNSFLHPLYPSKNDILYGLKLLFTRLVATGIERVDILMVGILSNQVAVADYAVAQRLANLSIVGHNIINPIFAPRMRYFIAHEQKESLRSEYKQLRFLTSIFSLIALYFFFIFGDKLLIIFGSYREARPILIILSGGFLIRQLFGSCGYYLNMSGHANLTLLSTIALLMIVVSLNWFLIPIYSATGAAVSTLMGLLLINGLISFLIWKIDNFKTFNFGILLAAFFISVISIFLALQNFNFWLSTFFSVSIAIIIIISDRKTVLCLLNNFNVKSVANFHK